MEKFWRVSKSVIFYFVIAILYLFLFLILWISSYKFLGINAYNYAIKNYSVLKHGNDDTVIVAIDDKSINEIRWPWKRSLYAKIVNYFSEYTDVKALATDMIIQGKDDVKNDAEFFNAVKGMNDRYVSVFIPSDRQYAEYFDGQSFEQKFYDKYKISIDDRRTNKYTHNYSSMLLLDDKFLDSVNYLGSAGNLNDTTGSRVFSLPLISLNGKLYPSFSLITYLLVNKTDKIILYDDKIYVDKTGLSIPVDNNFSYIKNNIKFYRLYPNTIYSHKQYSAIDIIKSYDNLKKGLKPLIDPSEFMGKVVFFGGNARGDVIGTEDSSRTPVYDYHPGVDIQATIFDNMVNDDFVITPNYFNEMLLGLCLSVLAFLIVMKLRFGTAISIILGIICGYWAVCLLHFYPNGYAPNIISPIAIILATLIFGYAFKFIAENRTKEKVKNAMGKYLSQTIMKNVVKNIDNVKLGGRKAVVTVLFADIRGFTSMSEKMSAEEVSMILNEYFSAIEPIITKYNGVINKFIGDAVMAIFGDPINDEMHPMNAVLCANDMLKRVKKLRNKWMDENKPEIEIGVGINTGEVFVGNIGSETRLEYTVIGDTVNIASRIESYNKVYKTNFLIGSTTYNSVKNRVDVIKISGVTIRGKQQKMDIYEILRVNSGED